MSRRTYGSPEQPTFGLDTFGDIAEGPDAGAEAAARALREVVAEAELADRVGIDHFSVGEHHRSEYAITAPEVVLGTIAGRTENITLGTAVTVLSSDDPVRVYERFATLDALSEGRAEITVGRGSFTESFPLFGFDLADYEVLFEERLDLLANILRGEPVTWEGTTRAALTDQTLYPPTVDGPIPTWVGVGGSPESVVRAAHHGLPLMLAVIGGSPDRFEPFTDLYRRALAQFDKPELPIGMHSPGHIAVDDATAAEEHFRPHRDAFARIGRERGWSPMSQSEYDGQLGERGALFVGGPETVARKIARAIRVLGLSRFDLKYAVGALPHDQRMESIRLYGEEVIPRVRELLVPSTVG